MKKILFLLSFLLIMSISALSQTSLDVWGGYSRLHGVVGVEAIHGNFGISAGYFPAKTPVSQNHLNSFSGAVNIYSNDYMVVPFLDVAGYGSIGFVSVGYIEERNNGTIQTEPMTMAILGAKLSYKNFGLRAGGGIGWCSEATIGTFEVGVSYRLFTRH